MTVQLPQRMGWDTPARASDFYGNVPPDLETLAEQSGARDVPMVRIVDQQSPWVGVTAPVVAELPSGAVRVRVSELVIVGLEVGEFQPA